MFRAGQAILIAVFLTAASPLPVPNPTHSGQPQSAEQEHSKPQQSGTQEQPGTYQAPGATSSAPLYVEAQCEHGCGHAESSEGWWQRLWTDPTATFTGVLALLTIALVVVGSIQAYRLQQTIQSMEAGAEREQRAYLSFHLTPGKQIVVESGKPMMASVVLKNSGKTPAHNVLAKGAIRMLPWPAPVPFPTDYPEQDMSQMVIPASGELGSNVKSAVPITDEEWAAITAGDKFRLYLFGEIVFEDVFGKRRRKPFRMQHGGTGDAAHVFIFCTEGNELDTEINS